VGWVSALDCEGRIIWIADAHREWKAFRCADELLTAFVELERQVLTMTFCLESIRPSDRDTNFTNSHESTPT
jgi:hypothetical protein